MSLVEEAIREHLAGFCPDSLSVRNLSHKHAHHASSPGTGQSHFHVSLVAACFAGMSRQERHRLVYKALAPLIPDPLHALSLHVTSTEEEKRTFS